MAGRPVVDRLDADGYGRVVVQGYPTLVVFVENDDGEDNVRVKAGIEAVAQKVRSKLGVAICNRQRDQMCQKLMEKVEVYSEELPQLIVVHWPDHEHSDFYLKYLFDENKITENTLFAFLVDYQRGFVDPYVRTEAEEDMKDQRVWKLVGTDISRRIKFGNKRTQDIVVLFHLGDTDLLSAKVEHI